MAKFKRISGGAVIFVFLSLLVTAIGSSAPIDFPVGATVSIVKGQTLSGAARILAGKSLIRSQTLFKVYGKLLEGTAGIKSGEYLFTAPESALRIADRMVNGEYGFPLLKITIPEGSDSSEVASIIEKSIPDFQTDDFLKLAKGHEGYLFPETYFWPSNVTPERVITEMTAQFDAKILTIKDELDKFGRPQADVIKMAAIIESEATSSADRRIVSDILWKRLDGNMALQVDAPFYYLLEKSSAKLTSEDLKIKSPYNLYTHTGLTPTPISNPGLSAILDTINPVKTEYWYFLSGKDGSEHYAKTLDEHVANKYKYLR